MDADRDQSIWENSRVSEDNVMNDFGRKLLEVCMLFDLTIVNGTHQWDDLRGSHLSLIKVVVQLTILL